MPSTSRTAHVLSEIGGPAVLLAVCILEVGVREQALWATAITLCSVAVGPYLATVLLARAGRVSDRFVANRRQRVPIFAGMLILVVGGLIALISTQAPAPLVWMVVAAIVALAGVAIVSVFWKISVHATVAAFFAGLQVALFGPLGLFGLVVLGLVVWARHELRLHTVAQLAAGSVFGFALALAYGAIAL